MKNLSNSLENLIVSEIGNNPLPYKKGNSIRVGPIAIRHSKKVGYIIFDCLEKKQVTVTYSRIAALAFAKHYNNRQKHEDILNLDFKIQKYSNDSVFYQNTITNASDNTKKNLAKIRLDLATAELETASHILENIIFEYR